MQNKFETTYTRKSKWVTVFHKSSLVRATQTPQTAATEKKSDSCQNCAFTIKDGGILHCGYDYFQIPPLERRTPKLTSFPEVANDNVCIRWSAVGASVLKAVPEPVTAKTAQTVYYLPGHGGLISAGLGQALL
jgi:hypothetical protein